MFERLLNKQKMPTFDDMISYSGDCGKLWLALDKWLIEDMGAAKIIRFPYGKSYGWGAKYSLKSKHICDIFAENGAFSVLIRVDIAAVDNIFNELTAYAKEIWQDNTPCGKGGWINYRVSAVEHLADIQKLINTKMPKLKL